MTPPEAAAVSPGPARRDTALGRKATGGGRPGRGASGRCGAEGPGAGPHSPARLRSAPRRLSRRLPAAARPPPPSLRPRGGGACADGQPIAAAGAVPCAGSGCAAGDRRWWQPTGAGEGRASRPGGGAWCVGMERVGEGGGCARPRARRSLPASTCLPRSLQLRPAGVLPDSPLLRPGSAHSRVNTRRLAPQAAQHCTKAG